MEEQCDRGKKEKEKGGGVGEAQNGKSISELRDDVISALDYLEHIVKLGPDISIGKRCQLAIDRIEADAFNIYVQHDTMRREVRDIWDGVKPMIRSLHGALSRAVGQATGMTLDDYLWARDELGTEEERRGITRGEREGE